MTAAFAAAEVTAIESSFEIVFLIVRSGLHVSEQHEGGESVVCIMTGGFEFMLWKGTSLALLPLPW